MRKTNVIATIASLFLGYVLLTSGDCPGTQPPAPDAGLYHTYDEIKNELPQLAAQHSAIAQVKSLGKSVEGRDLWAMKISDAVAQEEGEAEIILLGGHHAREWISVDVPFLIAKHLLENYGSDSLITRLVNETAIWVVPLVNPDGHQYTITTQRLWRKNRRNNNDGTFGVDLNRNYGYQWGGPGSSGDTYSETYRGPSPFSEPETQAIRDFLQSRAVKALISYHNFSQLVLYPWGYTSNPAPDRDLLNNLAVAMADRVRAVHGVRYTPQQSSDLYLASGDTTDWLYALLNVPAITIELRPSSSIPGFELPESQIQPTFEENLSAALFLMDWVTQQTQATL